MSRSIDSGKKEKLPSVFCSEVNRRSANLVSYGLATLVTNVISESIKKHFLSNF